MRYMLKKEKQTICLNIILQSLLFIFLVFADRLTKNIAVSKLKGNDPTVLIPDILEFRYIENSGAAFGIFQNRQWLFYILTVLILTAIIILFISLNIKLGKYSKLIVSQNSAFKHKTFTSILILNYILVTLAAGAVGNLIDRISLKYVVDFIYFKIVDFPVFNFADICVTLAAAALIIFFIIYKEDENFSIIWSKKEKKK